MIGSKNTNLKIDYQPVKTEVRPLPDENKSDIGEPMHKLLRFEVNRKQFEELTRDIYNNQGINDFKIITNKKTYDLKNAKTFWMKVTTSETTKKKLYNELIQKETDALTNEKSNDASKYNILNVLDNADSIFTGAYLHYKNVPKETMFERSITERIKLRKLMV